MYDFIGRMICVCTLPFLFLAQFSSLFNPAEYESEISVATPTGTDLFTAYFVIDSNTSFTHLRFQLVNTILEGEPLHDGNFRINGSRPPLLLPRQSDMIYPLIVSTDRMFNSREISNNITFSLVGSVITQSYRDMLISAANVTLHHTNGKTLCS